MAYSIQLETAPEEQILITFKTQGDKAVLEVETPLGPARVELTRDQSEEVMQTLSGSRMLREITTPYLDEMVREYQDWLTRATPPSQNPWEDTEVFRTLMDFLNEDPQTESEIRFHAQGFAQGLKRAQDVLHDMQPDWVKRLEQRGPVWELDDDEPPLDPIQVKTQ